MEFKSSSPRLACPLDSGWVWPVGDGEKRAKGRMKEVKALTPSLYPHSFAVAPASVQFHSKARASGGWPVFHNTSSFLDSNNTIPSSGPSWSVVLTASPKANFLLFL